MSRKNQYIALISLMVIFSVIRLINIQTPLPDRTDWKEIDHISISRNYQHNGFKLHMPEISWPAEPPRVTAMEFPLVPFLASLLYAMFGFNAVTLRIIPIVAFLVMSWYVFLLGRREFNSNVGLSGALASLAMPLYHPFGQMLFSEPLMIACSVMAIHHFAQWTDYRRKRDYCIALAGFSLAVALKLTPLYLLLPLSWICFRKFRWETGKYDSFLLFVFAALILPVLWYSWAWYLTYNSIDVFGIFRGHNKMQTLTMLANLNWYRTMLHRIGYTILGGFLWSFLCLAGFLAAIVFRKGSLILVYLVALVVFFVVVAEGQIDTSYRQLESIPVLSIFISLGIVAAAAFAHSMLSKGVKRYLKSQMPAALAISMAVISLLLFHNRQLIFNRDPEKPIDSRRWLFSRVIREHSSPDAKLITAGEYTIHVGGNDLSPVLYYYSGLQGWSLQREQWDLEYVERLRSKGATLFAAVRMSREPDSLPFIETMKSKYELLYENVDLELLLLNLEKK